MSNTPNSSLVRENLLTRAGYTPYCGSIRCRHGMPRTAFTGEQFECVCGWRSQFDPEFIAKYKAAQAPAYLRPTADEAIDKLASDAKRRGGT